MVAQILSWIAICTIAIFFIAGCERPSSRTADQAATGKSPVAATTPFELDYNAFDQTSGHGWRKLADDGRHVEAAELVDTYLQQNEDLEDWQRNNLRFHAGQLYAFGNDYPTAIFRFKASVSASEPKESPIRWNAYVRATLAFLEEDLEQLVNMRDEIAQGPELQGSVPNLDIVDRLIEKFGQPYSIAYEIKKHESRK